MTIYAANLLEPMSDPDIQIAGLRFWIHGRQFPELRDYWDGNWLVATVACSGPSAEVRANGPILHMGELKDWLKEVRKMHKSLAGEAELRCMEPNLNVKMSINRLGQLNMIVHITPDHLTQKHEFTFELDQSYLPGLIAGCERVLKEHRFRR